MRLLARIVSNFFHCLVLHNGNFSFPSLSSFLFFSFLLLSRLFLKTMEEFKGLGKEKTSKNCLQVQFLSKISVLEKVRFDSISV